MREKKILDLLEKLKKLDNHSLAMVETATDSCIVVQQLTALSKDNNIANLTALLG